MSTEQRSSSAETYQEGAILHVFSSPAIPPEMEEPNRVRRGRPEDRQRRLRIVSICTWAMLALALVILLVAVFILAGALQFARQ